MLKTQNAAEMIRYWHYPCEEHSIETKDGYILGFQRIPGSKHENTAYAEPLPYKRKPILIWHGLSISSDVFCFNVTPESNLALVLADAGYDVWLGNSRGNKYSRKHVELSTSDSSFWKYGIDELAKYDFPAGVDYILNATGHSNLSYIGYSQGTAQCFAALSMDEQLNEKLNVFIALAPAMKPKPIAHQGVDSLLRTLSPSLLYTVFGKGSFFGLADTVIQSLHFKTIGLMMQATFNHLFGWQCEKFGPSHLRSALFTKLYSQSSVRSIVHWFQIMHDENFKPYDSRRDSVSLLRPFPTLFESSIPMMRYPTKHISTRMHLFCGQRDNISDEAFLRDSLPLCDLQIIKDYEHMDFLWATNAKQVCWDRVLDVLPPPRDDVALAC